MAFVVGNQLTQYRSILVRKGAGKEECRVYLEPHVELQRKIGALLETIILDRFPNLGGRNKERTAESYNGVQ